MSLRRSARNAAKPNGTTTSSSEAVYQVSNAAPPSATKSEAKSKPANPPAPSPPTTPLPSKRQKRSILPPPTSASPIKPIPSTPTPAAVKLIATTTPTTTTTTTTTTTSKRRNQDHVLDNLASSSSGIAGGNADPHVTNAPVLLPTSTPVLGTTTTTTTIASPSKTPNSARKRKAAEPLPDVGSPLKRQPSSSTGNGGTLLDEAEAWLMRVDAEFRGEDGGRLERLIRAKRCAMFSPEGLREVVEPFTALASGIVGQQVSGAAASSIRAKLTSLFPETHPSFPSPAQILTKDIPTLRTAGLSQRKAEYITGLAEKFAAGEITAEGLVGASDEDLIRQLVAVRGLGRWSVEMFACFGLKRMDVFSTGDLGVQRGMAAYVGRDVAKLKNKGGKWKYMSEQEMLEIASKFSPYRSLFMWYMWRIADVETEVLE